MSDIYDPCESLKPRPDAAKNWIDESTGDGVPVRFTNDELVFRHRAVCTCGKLKWIERYPPSPRWHARLWSWVTGKHKPPSRRVTGNANPNPPPNGPPPAVQTRPKPPTPTHPAPFDNIHTRAF